MRVDLPTPGSPPISSAEPGTMPPPVTRSNSAIPVPRRCGALSSVLRSSSAKRRPFSRLVAPAPIGAGAPSSVMVFHPLHDSQRPDLLEDTAPQDWQTKVGEDRAMIRLYQARQMMCVLRGSLRSHLSMTGWVQ